MNSRPHEFGGHEWTQRKLDALSKYLCAYTTALKKSHFNKTYVDAFAGSGTWTPANRNKGIGESEADLFPDWIDEEEARGFRDGSARIALQTVPAFDRCFFIEQSSDRCAELAKLKDEFPNSAKRIEIHHGEANSAVRDFCESMRPMDRAVVFLDPYGMQVRWTTIERIAATTKIDLWVLFPVAMGPLRMLPDAPGEGHPAWEARLDQFFGTQDWRQDLYASRGELSLFSQDGERSLRRPTAELLGSYIVRRLKETFPEKYVVEEPLVLRNSRSSPLFLLCFAAGNERGGPIAVRIARDIIEGMR